MLVAISRVGQAEAINNCQSTRAPSHSLFQLLYVFWGQARKYVVSSKKFFVFFEVILCSIIQISHVILP